MRRGFLRRTRTRTFDQAKTLFVLGNSGHPTAAAATLSPPPWMPWQRHSPRPGVTTPPSHLRNKRNASLKKKRNGRTSAIASPSIVAACLSARSTIDSTNDRSILQNCEHRSAMSDLSVASRSSTDECRPEVSISLLSRCCHGGYVLVSPGAWPLHHMSPRPSHSCLARSEEATC